MVYLVEKNVKGLGTTCVLCLWTWNILQ